MQWFQISEKAAGKKRLILSWYIYKVFGKKSLYLIAFFVSLFSFLFSPDIRQYTKKYFQTIQNIIGLKPSLYNCFKLVNSYANSLVDKLLVYAGDFNPENILFDNIDDKNSFFKDINNKTGVFLICSHIGNIEIMQSMFFNETTKPDFGINVFLSNKQSKIFNSFISKIKTEIPVKLFSVEEIGIDTGVCLKENLERGEVVFIAGDRVSEINRQNNIEKTMFNKKVYLPGGTFKLAKLMDVPTYFISAVKTKKGYRIYLERQKILEEGTLTDSYVKYLEKIITTSPFQFYHFYDFFND